VLGYPRADLDNRQFLETVLQIVDLGHMDKFLSDEILSIMLPVGH